MNSDKITMDFIGVTMDLKYGLLRSPNSAVSWNAASHFSAERRIRWGFFQDYHEAIGSFIPNLNLCRLFQQKQATQPPVFSFPGFRLSDVNGNKNSEFVVAYPQIANS